MSIPFTTSFKSLVQQIDIAQDRLKVEGTRLKYLKDVPSNLD